MDIKKDSFKVFSKMMIGLIKNYMAPWTYKSERAFIISYVFAFLGKIRLKTCAILHVAIFKILYTPTPT